MYIYSCENQDVPAVEETTRKQRLDLVRRTFLELYTPLIGGMGPADAGGGTLSGLLDNFAEKVGFKQNRSTYV